MLSTESASFKVNRNGTMDVYPIAGMSIYTIPLIELQEIVCMAIDYARLKKIRKPTRIRTPRGSR